MANLAGFNAAEIEPTSTYEVLPIGDYVAMIVESEIKPTSSGYGQYLQLVWQIVEGEHEGRKIWDRLNIQSPNAIAQEIAQKALSAICRAIGILQPNDSEELHDKAVMIKVGIQPAKGQYDASNTIKGYSSISGAQVTQAVQQAPANNEPAPQKQAAAQQSKPGPVWATN